MGCRFETLQYLLFKWEIIALQAMKMYCDLKSSIQATVGHQQPYSGS